MNFRSSLRLALTAVAVGSLPANAAVITFNFSGPSGNLGTTESFTVDGITLNAYGFTYARFGTPAGTWQPADIVRVSGALGIDNSSVPDGFHPDLHDNSSQIDNSGWYDLLVFELPDGFGPRRIKFDDVNDDDDDWVIGWDSSLLSLAGLTPSTLFSSLDGRVFGDSHQYGFGPLDTSKRYLYIGGKDRHSSDGDDGFYVDKLKIKGDPADPVPEPGTLLLLGSGLALGRLMHRRRPR